jgi:hypothetical protein
MHLKVGSGQSRHCSHPEQLCLSSALCRKEGRTLPPFTMEIQEVCTYCTYIATCTQHTWLLGRPIHEVLQMLMLLRVIDHHLSLLKKLPALPPPTPDLQPCLPPTAQDAIVALSGVHSNSCIILAMGLLGGGIHSL